MILDLYSVTSINKYIKERFDNDFTLRGLRVKGEISNFKRYPSGHIYFTLKDTQSAIKAVMFSDYTKYLPKNIKDGDEVITYGRISVYPQRGEYQIYVEAIELFGKGNQLLELELLKKKLQAEGLFDEVHKKPINIYPKAIGVISARNSAAMVDIRTNLLRRYPLVEIYMFPSLVQGVDAPKDLLRALKEAQTYKLDTIIIGRGGGASEDLSAFNDEALVREAFNCKIPIISAVGHEIDTTLIDYVADKRASTPTGAAELATVDKREIFERLMHFQSDLIDIISNKVELLKSRFNNLKNRPFINHPETMYQVKLDTLKNTTKILNTQIKNIIEKNKHSLSLLSEKLEMLSPNNVLNRGFAMINDEEGHIIKNIDDIKIDQTLNITMHKGKVITKVINKEKNNG